MRRIKIDLHNFLHLLSLDFSPLILMHPQYQYFCQLTFALVILYKELHCRDLVGIPNRTENGMVAFIMVWNGMIVAIFSVCYGMV